MDIRAAEVFGQVTILPVAAFFTSGGLGEEDGALPFDDDGLVTHRRHISAARGARAHHAGDLRDAGGGERGLVVEDAAEMVAVGENLRLVRQVRAAAIHQIDARQPVLPRDLLRAQVLLHRHRIIGAALDRRARCRRSRIRALDAPDPGDDPGAMNVAVIHPVGGQWRKLEERRPRVDQPLDARARQQLAALGVALARRRSSPPRAVVSSLAFEFLAVSLPMASALALNAADVHEAVDLIVVI